MTDDRDRTLAAIAARVWRVVLLYPHTKKPAAAKGEPWPITADVAVVHRHLDQGGNLGLLGGDINGVVIVDIDQPAVFTAMETALGPLGEPWVRTGSGKVHYYLQWEARLPAKLLWEHTLIGEIQRGPGQQQVVMPPSVHPDTGHRYTWLVDPVITALPRLPERWRRHILEPPRPAASWRGSSSPRPPVDASLRDAALAQPDARPRPGKIKFACPACRAEGFDVPGDNAVYFETTGRWGCAWATGTPLGRRHWDAIGRALGILS